jgi:hypothetical protein
LLPLKYPKSFAQSGELKMGIPLQTINREFMVDFFALRWYNEKIGGSMSEIYTVAVSRFCCPKT